MKRRPSSSASERRNTDSSLSKRTSDSKNVESEVEKHDRELQEKYEQVKNKLEITQNERNSAEEHLKNISEECENEIFEKDSQIEQKKTELEEMQNRLDSVDRIEAAIVNLYMEMQGRSYEEIKSNTDNSLTEFEQEKDKEARTEELEQERERLRQRNPIVILSELSSNLRSLLEFKDRYENELKKEYDRVKTEEEKQVDVLKNKIEEMRNSIQEFVEKSEEANKKKEEAEQSKRLLESESEDMIASIRKANAELREVSNKKHQEEQDLQDMIDHRDKILREKEIRMMRITQLQSQMQKNKSNHERDLKAHQESNEKTLHKFENKLANITKLQAEKKEKEDILKSLDVQLASFQHDTNLRDIKENEENIEMLSRKLTLKQQELSRLKERAQQVEDEESQLGEQNKEMQKSLHEISKAAKTEKKVHQRQKERAFREKVEKEHHELAERNPYVVGFYKQRLREKEKQKDDLTKRVRRMILAEHRDSIMDKNFQLERTQLLGELTTRKKEVPHIQRLGMNDNQWEPTMRDRITDTQFREAERDNENKSRETHDITILKSKAQTTATAYNRMLKSDDNQKDSPDHPSRSEKQESENKKEGKIPLSAGSKSSYRKAGKKAGSAKTSFGIGSMA
eukprot:gb/GECH01014931.1/.p1 GENE.gb/GECH01014931.1/~~gb/GECH01014931.1/.p1  ORF type:complete len:628 (+),score=191.10 gb/GECH01014931.1/:1-1884(+)